MREIFQRVRLETHLPMNRGAEVQDQNCAPCTSFQEGYENCKSATVPVRLCLSSIPTHHNWVRSIHVASPTQLRQAHILCKIGCLFLTYRARQVGIHFNLHTVYDGLKHHQQKKRILAWHLLDYDVDLAINRWSYCRMLR